MSTHDNVRLVNRFFEAVVHDPGNLDEICASDFKLVEPDLFPAPFTDLASYKAFLTENPLTGWTFTVSDADPIAESVSIRYTAVGVWGGQPVTLTRKANIQLWDGRIQRYDGTAVPADAPATAGMR